MMTNHYRIRCRNLRDTLVTEGASFKLTNTCVHITMENWPGSVENIVILSPTLKTFSLVRCGHVFFTHTVTLLTYQSEYRDFFLSWEIESTPNLSIHSMLCTYMRVIAFTHVQDSMRCSPYDIRLLEPLYKRTVVSNPKWDTVMSFHTIGRRK